MRNVRYIGNKSSQAVTIVSRISQAANTDDPIIGDLFSGTGAISAQLKRTGHRVHANDYLRQCEVRARAILLLSSEPSFENVRSVHNDWKGQSTILDSGYAKMLSYLNRLEGEEGFFFRAYSPEGSHRFTDWVRKYFTEDNAKRIDAVRRKIGDLKLDGEIDDIEHELLLVNLIEAINEVANISGTYGCFLKEFQSCALEPLTLKPFKFVAGKLDHIVTGNDIFDVAQNTPSELVYLDPPFTKRQYAAYYHIPETIALEDEPEVFGKTGIRSWKEKASGFYYKSKALKALEKLVEALSPREIFLSYSSDGHLNKEEILDMLQDFGAVDICQHKQKRFKSSKRGGNKKSLYEYLFHLERGDER